MKKYNSFFKFLLVAFAALATTGCVHDDQYEDPTLENFQCQDLVATVSIAEVKALYKGTTYVFPSTSTDVMEGYVSSTDESGNIYKTIYIQDKAANPTQGFTISVDAVSTYTKYPQGSKIYIKLADLALGVYGGLVQLGVKNGTVTTTNGVARIPEKDVPKKLFRSCTIRENIVPRVITLAEMVTANDALLGALIQVNDAEFDRKNLCGAFAPRGFSVDRQINDPTASLTTRVVRNSGYATFANQNIPAGKGKFIGIYSKFNASYQMYINKIEDLKDMVNFPRKDGITADPCVFDPNSGTSKTVAEVKQLFSGSLTQITGEYILKGQVTANDETGNLYKYLYLEDATGGIRININKLNLYQDARFRVGKELIVKLKDLYIGNVNGELQIGQPFNGNAGQINEVDVYKFFVGSTNPRTAVIPTERTITQLTAADVGRYVKIKGVQFIDTDLFKTYAVGTATTNLTLQDCSNNKVLLRTSGFADFAGKEVDGGKGDVTAIVSIFNGVYQLWIPFQRDADFDNPRCDGTIPAVYTSIFSDGFETLAKWTTKSVKGAQIWGTTTFGNPRPSAFMDGNRLENEDWLISPKIALTGMADSFLSFETDGRFTGNPLEVYITENYSGDPTTTTWVKLNAALDTDLNNYAGFVSSGRVSLNAYNNKEVVIAFKYTSVVGSSTAWELDNVAVKGSK